ncbi:MAG: CoA-binding protein [Dehalococcoidia bacterium]|nr:CoA-binding protein [Dehalococcoidia bacterium]
MTSSQQEAKSLDNIAALFEPNSVAIIGSTKEGFFGGYTAIRNLQKFGFKGKIYPVNPGGGEVLGLKAYPTVSSIPEPIDAAMIMTSSKAYPQIIEDIIAKGAKAATIVSDGFAERDEEGARLQRRIVEIAKKAGLRIIGPNTVGVANTSNGFMANPYILQFDKVYPGSIALYTQSGMLGSQALAFEDSRLRISKLIDVGNKSDVDESDALEYFGNDPHTDVISMHVESVRDGRRFMQTARSVAARKPVIALKPGREKEAAIALASHTGSLAGEDSTFDAAFKQSGIIRVNTRSELLEYPKIFSHKWHLPAGKRMGLVSYSGGAAVLAIDAAVKAGMTVAEWTPETKAELEQITPGLGHTPIDLGMSIPRWADLEPTYARVLELAVWDRNTDFILMLLALGGPGVDKLTERLIVMRKKTNKPIAIWLFGPKLPRLNNYTSILDEAGLPVFSSIENAVGALSALCQYAEIKSNLAKEQIE